MHTTHALKITDKNLVSFLLDSNIKKNKLHLYIDELLFFFLFSPYFFTQKRNIYENIKIIKFKNIHFDFIFKKSGLNLFTLLYSGIRGWLT